MKPGIIVFAILSLFVTLVSYRNLTQVKSHGFYRLFSWIGMSWVFSRNYIYWFDEVFSINQIISWGLLVIAAILALSGGYLLIKKGKPSDLRDDPPLFGFEKTTGLIDTGVYRYIRHPLYSSLIYLAWGICLKNPEPELIIITVICSFLLYLTAKLDEKECIIFFKDEYTGYMKRSKMFIPFIF